MTTAHTLELAWKWDGIVLTARWLDGSEAKRLFRNEAGLISVPLIELQAGSGSWFEGAMRYTMLGIEHILLGIDHLLFVLALLLIVRGGWMLVKTITAFTIAHSITLDWRPWTSFTFHRARLRRRLRYPLCSCLSKSSMAR